MEPASTYHTITTHVVQGEGKDLVKYPGPNQEVMTFRLWMEMEMEMEMEVMWM